MPSFAGSFWWRPRSSDRDLKPRPSIKPTFFMLFIKCTFWQFIYNPTYTLCVTPFFKYQLHVSAPDCDRKGVIIAKIYKAADQSTDKYGVSHSAYVGWYIKNQANTLILVARQLSKWGLYFDYWNHTSICSEKKNQLDATEWFIALIICSTCFGHFYSHHQKL